MLHIFAYNRHQRMKELDRIYDGIRKDDRASFEALFRCVYPVLCTFALKYVPDIEDAENIVQDVMLNIWENRKSSDIKDIKSYLFTSVRNRCLTFSTQSIIRERILMNIQQQNSASFLSFETWNELAIRLEDALKEVPEESRRMFEMNRFYDYRYKEIADQMNVSTKTVAWRISNVLKHLRIRLKDFLPPDGTG
ncbi:MAG: RNA polymerase sigma-70 factor [Candidatus Cryptobacteroides sp.]